MTEVLVVDDERDIRDVVSFLLMSRGYEVREAVDGLDALQRLKERTPDAVVLDIMMPGLDGREVLRAMHADPALAGVPVVIVSGAADLGQELDGCAVLKKPVEPEALIAAVARCAERGSSARP